VNLGSIVADKQTKVKLNHTYLSKLTHLPELSTGLPKLST